MIDLERKYEDLFEKEILFCAFPLPPYRVQRDGLIYPVSGFASKMTDIFYRPDLNDTYKIISYRLDEHMGPAFLMRTKIKEILGYSDPRGGRIAQGHFNGELCKDSFCVSVSYYPKDDGSHDERFANDIVIDRISTMNSCNRNSHIWFPYSSVLSEKALRSRWDDEDGKPDFYRDNYKNGILLNTVTFKAFENELLANSVVSAELEMYLKECANAKE